MREVKLVLPECDKKSVCLPKLFRPDPSECPANGLNEPNLLRPEKASLAA
jgi:hypothetical protein